MINYSTINDAWGNKEIYKKNDDKKVETKCQTPTPEPTPTTSIDIKKDIFIEPPVVENFSSCNMMEHITNCPECLNKMKELFTPTHGETITLPGCNIKISKDALKVVFVLIIICIILLFISIINKKDLPPAYSYKYQHMPYYLP